MVFTIIPSTRVYIRTLFGARPYPNGTWVPFQSKVLLPGLHWTIPGIHAIEAELPTDVQPVSLFRHDDGERDVAEIELSNMSAKLRVIANVQISGGSDAGVLDPAAFWDAYYKAPENPNSSQPGPDFMYGAELVISPRVKEAYQNQPLEIKFIGDKDRALFSQTGVISVTQRQLLYNLGLRYPEAGEGDFVLPDDTSPRCSTGKDIIRKLAKFGVKLIDFSIGDLDPPPEIVKARQSIGITESEAAASLLHEQKQARIIEERNANLLLHKQGEAAALKTEALGFVQAVSEATQASNDKLTEKQVFEVLVQYPALEKVIGKQAKILFTNGGSGGDVMSLIRDAFIQANEAKD